MIVTVAASNEQSLAIQQLADMVAACGPFQEQCGVATDAEALEFVHYPEYAVENEQIDKPFAVIYPKTYTPRRLADGIVIPAGVLNLQLGLTVENFDEQEGEERRFDNWQGDIIRRIQDTNATSAGYRMLCTQSIPPMRSNDEHVAALLAQHPFWFCEYEVTWDPFG